MFAVPESDDTRTIHVSRSVSTAFNGVTSGYRVQFHSLPAYTFLVDADCADDAQRYAYMMTQGRAASNAATIQKF